MPHAQSGRPPSYTQPQLRAAMDAAEAETGETRPSVVRKLMHDMFGVEMTISLTSLKDNIDKESAQRDQAAEAARLDALPDEVFADADRWAEDCRRRFLTAAGHAYARQRDAETQRRRRWDEERDRLQELLGIRDQEITDQSAREQALTASLAADAETIAALNARVVEMEGQLKTSAAFDDVLAALKTSQQSGVLS